MVTIFANHTNVYKIEYKTKQNKKAELTPELARDRAATWRLILNLDSSAAIEGLTCAATWRKR